jgi:hypothetical protein
LVVRSSLGLRQILLPQPFAHLGDFAPLRTDDLTGEMMVVSVSSERENDLGHVDSALMMRIMPSTKAASGSGLVAPFIIGPCILLLPCAMQQQADDAPMRPGCGANIGDPQLSADIRSGCGANLGLNKDEDVAASGCGGFLRQTRPHPSIRYRRFD